MKTATGLMVAGLIVTTAALAHAKVSNAAVKARIDAMSTIGKHTQTLGNMAKGAAPFDAKAARAAAAGIAEQAALVPGLFALQEDDPVSEAKPNIWDNFGDFTARAEELEKVALAAAANIAQPKDLPGALGNIGKACASCHQLYRE